MDEFQKIKKEINESAFMVKDRKEELSEKQVALAQQMNETIEADRVLQATDTAELTDEEMKAAYSNKYEEDLKQKQKPETDRQKKKVRKQAEGLGDSAMKLHQQLMKFADDGTDYKEVMNNSFALSKIVNYKGAKSPQMNVLKKSAPAIFERGLKISHALMALSKQKDKYPKLYAFALDAFQQTAREWRNVEEIADKYMVYNVTIDKDAEDAQLKEHVVDRAEVEGDMYYMDEYEERMKKKKVNWDSDDGSDGVEPSVKKVLKEQMQKVLDDFPGTTPDEVESTVNEYLKRIAENSEFRIRMNMGVVGKVLNSRYHSRKGAEAYKDLIHKQYSPKTEIDPSQAIAFGSLGGLTAKDFIGYGSNNDPCCIYGNVSIRLDKEAMKDHVSFVSGNSLDHYDEKHGRSAFIDEKNGVAPDITMCGTNLVSIYRRARELKENGWKGMLSSEQEAGKSITDHGDYPYFEAHYHGNVRAEQIAEVTWICPRISGERADFRKRKHVEELKEQPEFKKLYEFVKIVNNNPGVYGREGKEEMKLTVWDLNGNTVSYKDLKSIFG